MEKTKKGKRGIVLLDSIDLAILTKIYYSKRGIGILRLVKTLSIKHKNIKPHLDKLFNANLISYVTGRLIFKDYDNAISLISLLSSINKKSKQDFRLREWKI